MSTKRFYDTARPLFGTMSAKQKEGMDLILGACKSARLNQQGSAYCLATAFHETGATMEPVSENLNYSAKRLLAVFSKYFSIENVEEYARKPMDIANRAYAGRMGNDDEASGDGWKYRGRGYVQLTGEDNYRRIEEWLGIPMLSDPDRARDPDVAAKILVIGMQRGMFTGVSLDDVSEPGTSPDFTNDRAIVNGKDRAKLIAGYAETFFDALKNVDLLAESRTIKATKSSNRAADIGILTGAGALVKQVTDVLGEDPGGVVAAAKQGSALSSLLPWLGAGAATLFIALFIYQKVQAKRAENARREDNEILGV